MKKMLVLAAALILAACSDDDGAAAPGPTDAGGDDVGGDVSDDDAIAPPVDHPFLFGVDPAQNITQAPFPNDLYLNDQGRVALPALETDPVLATLGKAELLAQMQDYASERNGFSSTSAIWLWMTEPPANTDLDPHVEMVALAGPEAGRRVAVQTTWNPRANAIGVFPAWGEYLVPGSTYAVLIKTGLQTEAGDAIALHPTFQAVIGPEDAPDGGPKALEGLADARTAFAPLREWLSTADDAAPEDYVVGTVFTTQTVIDVGDALFAGAEAFDLEPITRRYRYDVDAAEYVEAADVDGAQLDTYFGSPLPPFAFNPGLWGGSRERAADLTGEPYTGGTAHYGIARVVNGSFIMPAFNFRIEDGQPLNQRLQIENGAAVPGARAMVPFSLFLCGSHLSSPDGVPVAIFNHGGGAIRSDAVAFANANCQIDVATIAVDMVFHGGRRRAAYEPGGDLIVPVEADKVNVYTGLEEGAPGYEPDFVGDPGAAAASVGQLFGLEYGGDPLIIEANQLTIAVDTGMVLRYVREGDWSPILEGLRFDDGKIFHNSLSFGTSYATPLLALSEGFRGVVGSVGSGAILSVNMPMGPANALQASALLIQLLGLPVTVPDMQSNSQWTVMLGLHQWLHERGDPLAWAPHVLRYRDGLRPDVMHSGNSWDETLFNQAQLSFANALGLTSYTAGEEWTIDPTVPGADTLDAQPLPEGGASGNVTFGEQTVTAAILWRDRACHGMVVSALCTENYEHPYPPLIKLATPVVSESPICGLHAQAIAFTSSLMSGAGNAVVIPPVATCEEVYSD